MGDLKRRDHKGRILYNGEYQEKDGSYTYRYTECGKRKKLTSWRLTNADPIPSGKKAKAPLREQIKDLKQYAGAYNCNITVREQVKKYISTKTDAAYNTKRRYRTLERLLEKEAFGDMLIKDVKYSNALRFLQKMQIEGKKYGTVNNIRGMLKPAFQMAVMDELIPKNPFDFSMKDVMNKEELKREALSQEDEQKFLDFIKNDKYYRRYYDFIYILFKTGLRISEFCGLTKSDIDFEKHELTVDHQLQRAVSGEYFITPTKTKAGNCILPMSPDVECCFRKILKNRESIPIEPIVKDNEGKSYVGFLGLTKVGTPLCYIYWEAYFRNICAKYNKIYKDMPLRVTPHICRHTYCSRMVASGISPKSLQYLMGHSDIGTTMNVYTTFRLEDVKEELARLG